MIKKLLTRDPKKRLGSKGIEEVKSHPFFNGNYIFITKNNWVGIDWNTLREAEAPIIPRSLEEEIQDDENKGTPKVARAADFKRSNTASISQIDFGAFKLCRLDLLYEENLKNKSQFLKRYLK